MDKQEGWKEEREAMAKLCREDMVEELIRRYRPMVYAAARRLAPRMKGDEDLLQCGLIGLWKAAEQWDEARPFPPLARRCVENEMISYLRRQSRQLSTVPLGAAEETLAYHEDWSAAEVRCAADQSLPPRSRERALLLAVADGYSVADAAARVGLSRQTAKRKLRRGCQRLGLVVATGEKRV